MELGLGISILAKNSWNFTPCPPVSSHSMSDSARHSGDTKSSMFVQSVQYPLPGRRKYTNWCISAYRVRVSSQCTFTAWALVGMLSGVIVSAQKLWFAYSVPKYDRSI